MADKVVRGEHHFADIAVKTRFVPVLTMTEKAELFNVFFEPVGLMKEATIRLMRFISKRPKITVA